MWNYFLHSEVVHSKSVFLMKVEIISYDVMPLQLKLRKKYDKLHQLILHSHLAVQHTSVWTLKKS